MFQHGVRRITVSLALGVAALGFASRARRRAIVRPALPAAPTQIPASTVAPEEREQFTPEVVDAPRGDAGPARAQEPVAEVEERDANTATPPLTTVPAADASPTAVTLPEPAPEPPMLEPSVDIPEVAPASPDLATSLLDRISAYTIGGAQVGPKRAGPSSYEGKVEASGAVPGARWSVLGSGRG